MKLSRNVHLSSQRRQAIALLFACLCGLTSAAYPLTAATLAEEHHYQEVTGEAITDSSWQLVKDDKFVLTCASPKGRHVTTTSLGFNTIRWALVNEHEKTNLIADRTGEIIMVRGTFKGKFIDKSLKIDKSPWYQATSLSLRGLVSSRDTERIFWTIRLSTMTAHKVRAIKKNIETIDIDGSHQELLRIRMTLTGILAPFWKSDFWFSMPGGVLIRFEGPSGPPGSPNTIITRIKS